MLPRQPDPVALTSRRRIHSEQRRTRPQGLWGCLWAIALFNIVLAAPTAAEDGFDKLTGDSVIPFSQTDSPVAPLITIETVAEGSSSKQQRREAIDQLPTQFLNGETQAMVNDVLKSLSLYRRLPTTKIDIDHKVYTFFAENPDVAVSIWRAMMISRVDLKQVGPFHFETNTHDGTQGKVVVLYRTPTSQLVYCDGQFQSPALPKAIRAVALMHLQSQMEETSPSVGAVTHSVDLFVSFPSQAFETVAKVVSPVSNRIADRNFQEISLFLEMMQGIMARQPGWVEQIVQKMEGVSPESKETLLKVTATTYVDSQRRQQQKSGNQLTVEELRLPVRTASQPGRPKPAD